MGCSCSQGKVWVGGGWGSCSRRKLQVCFNLLAKCGEELQNLARSVADDDEYYEDDEADVEEADSGEVAVAGEVPFPTCDAADSGMKGCKQMPMVGRKAPIVWGNTVSAADEGVPVTMGGKKAALLRAACR